MLDKKFYCVKISDETQYTKTGTTYNEEVFKSKNNLCAEELYKIKLEKNFELEEEKYSKLLSIAYALIAIISESPYYVIVSMADFFKNAFNVDDAMINEFTIIESVILVVGCLTMHLIGSYRLKLNLYSPLINIFFLGILYLVVLFKNDYIGHKILIFSAFPLGSILCIAKMTTMKICALFKKPYCSSYVCGLSLSGFLVFLLYVLGAYVLFPNDEKLFYNLFTLYCGIISMLSFICFLMLYKVYNMSFVKSLEEKYGNTGIHINKNILIRSFYSISIVWNYIILAFLSHFLTYQVYPSVFPAGINIRAESKGFLSGVLLFGDSLARLIVHNLDTYFANFSIIPILSIKIFRVALFPIFLFIIICKNTILNNLLFLTFLAFIHGFSNGLICNIIFLKLPEVCKRKNNEEDIQLIPNILYIALILGTTIGCLTSKIYMKILNI